MAEQLKDNFSTPVVIQIADMIEAVYPEFQKNRFIEDCLKDFEPMSLKERGRHISKTMRQRLPEDYPEALAILLDSVRNTPELKEKHPMASFLFLPHVLFTGDYGKDFFEDSMRAQYELTQRFTAEFSIRTFIENYPEKTLARLHVWATDPNMHVRRLVSEGTRPRLPWADRLHRFIRNPQPVLELLEKLKDDEELYVRRSVANNLNDIAKDHPDLVIRSMKRWMKNASIERKQLIRHALRTLIKKGSKDALELIGFSGSVSIQITEIQLMPSKVRFGEKVNFQFTLTHTGEKTQKLLVDFRVHFIKKSGKPSPKVFKLSAYDLKPGGTIRVQKSLSLAEKTTRKHYPGNHRIELLINGNLYPLGSFMLEPKEPKHRPKDS